MTPEAFLDHWKAAHINSGTQQSDVPTLVETLLVDAAKANMSRQSLEQAAGMALEDHLIGAIREAIEEELR